MSLGVKPINDLVLIKPNVQPLSDVIITPDNHYEPESIGEVVSFGNGMESRTRAIADFVETVLERFRTWQPSPNQVRSGLERELIEARDAYRPAHVCQVGDMVAFHPKDGQEIAIDGTLYLMIREDDLLAVVEPVEA